MKPIQNITPIGLPRDEYGALYTSQVLSQEQQLQLKDLLGKAVATGIVPEPFITCSKKEIQSLNLDIFDVLVFRGKVKGLVVQARSYWKNIRKGYTRIQKSYFLVMRSGKKLDIKELENSTCVKRAKNTTALGQLVNHYLGKTTVACKSGAKVAMWTGDKVLARDEKGSACQRVRWLSVRARHLAGGNGKGRAWRGFLLLRRKGTRRHSDTERCNFRPVRV